MEFYLLLKHQNKHKLKKIDKEYYEVENVKGFVMMINNFNCKKTKYFDDKFFLYLEEIDLCIRLRKIKKLICLAPNIFVKHLGGKSHSNKFSKKWKCRETGTIYGPYFILPKNTMV